MKTAAIRDAFLQYFCERGHQLVPSSPLVPGNDPSLLFTNAGMVQFKEVFLGEQRSYVRAVSSQRCVRAGGKHNDLDNVGYTARHHTFFEMLGNFSFGDYFKHDAIAFAWDFLTNHLHIPKEKLWVTVFHEDTEAERIWIQDIGVDPQRISRCGAKDNFWAMGDTGPCGPCTEIFYDHGPEVAGGPPGSPDADGDRYIEIWNLVFMQYDRSAAGELTPLPKPSVDTGMGLERVAAVMQGVHSNYQIDLFQLLIKAAAEVLHVKDLTATSLRVIADHIRSTSFLIVDGVIPSNEGRGYVLRRIIRRAIRHGNKLGATEPFFHRLVPALVAAMGEAYPELAKAQTIIQNVLLQEEQQFARTLEQGLKILEADLSELPDNKIPGATIFKLYDTYGFPVDLTGDIARERDLILDMDGFELAMAEQRQMSQAASQFATMTADKLNLDAHTEFQGYDKLQFPAKIVSLLIGQDVVTQLPAGVQGAIVLDKTPFYPEGGGQVGDVGIIKFANGEFHVQDTKKYNQAILHFGVCHNGQLEQHMVVDARVDHEKRRATMLNHSATHLLHAALRTILGEHVTQKGSLVEPARLRFDFTHYEAITAQQLQKIESLVNQKIRENLYTDVAIMSPEAATKTGAMALFGEKYGEKVRVLSMGNFSKELCGGTHVHASGEIGLFKIMQEAGIAAGIRRIEAVTGAGALAYVTVLETELRDIAGLLKANREQALEKVTNMLQRNRELEKQVEQAKAKLANSASSDLASQAERIAGVNVLVAKLDNVEPKSLRGTLDQLKTKLGSAVIVLASTNDDRVNVIAGISKDCLGKTPAPSDLVAVICGKGGGRDDMAQGGGALPADLDLRLQKVSNMIKESL